jgi:exopolysaccharide production protein ExoZ
MSSGNSASVGVAAPGSLLTVPDPGRITVFDAMRAYAVWLTFMVHFSGYYASKALHLDLDGPLELLQLEWLPAVMLWAHKSHFGVFIFFVLSGYLIARTSEKKPYGRFLWARIRRIYPAFLVSLCVALLLYRWVSEPVTGVPLAAETVLANLVFLNGFLPARVPAYHFVTWSLFYEAIFYLSYPLIHQAGRYQRWLEPACIAGFLVAMRLIGDPLWIMYVPLFLGAGVYRAQSAGWGGAGQRLLTGRLVLAGAAYLALSCAFLFLPPAQVVDGLPQLGLGFLLFIPCFGLVIAWLIGHAPALEPLWRRVPGCRAWCAIGEMSYSVYLWHTLCIALVFYGLRGPLNGSLPGLLLASLCLTGAVSWLSYRWVERPFFQGRRHPAIGART